MYIFFKVPILILNFGNIFFFLFLGFYLVLFRTFSAIHSPISQLRAFLEKLAFLVSLLPFSKHVDATIDLFLSLLQDIRIATLLSNVFISYTQRSQRILISVLNIFIQIDIFLKEHHNIKIPNYCTNRPTFSTIYKI